MDSGLFQMPRMLIIVIVTPIAGRLYNYMDSRLLISCGVALVVVGYLDMAEFTLEVG